MDEISVLRAKVPPEDYELPIRASLMSTEVRRYMYFSSTGFMMLLAPRPREENCYPYLFWPTHDSRPTALWLTLTWSLGNKCWPSQQHSNCQEEQPQSFLIDIVFSFKYWDIKSIIAVLLTTILLLLLHRRNQK
eukprot:g41559.t1